MASPKTEELKIEIFYAEENTVRVVGFDISLSNDINKSYVRLIMR